MTVQQAGSFVDSLRNTFTFLEVLISMFCGY